MKKIHESPEEELQTVYKKLLFHLENTPLGFIKWDHQLVYKPVFKRAEEIFGCSIPGLKGKVQAYLS